MIIQRSLLPEGEALTLHHLVRYHGLITGSGRFSGGSFDAFDPSGHRADSTDVFTSDDLDAVTLLPVDVPAGPRWRFGNLVESAWGSCCRKVGPDRDLVAEASVDKESFGAAWRLWAALRSIKGLGATTVSKLIINQARPERGGRPLLSWMDGREDDAMNSTTADVHDPA